MAAKAHSFAGVVAPATGPQRGGVESTSCGIHSWAASVDPEDSLKLPALVGKEGTGAGPEIPVTLLSGSLSQRPELLRTTLSFINRTGVL